MMQLIQDERLRLGAIVLGILFSIAFISYSIGVYVGNRSTLEQCTEEMNPLKLEVADLKKQLKQKDLEKVGRSAQEAADLVINCEALCAQEVNEALRVATSILCGETQ